MRAWEFLDLIKYDSGDALARLGDTRRPRMTLRYINRLKQQRKRREREQAAKAPLIARMYGDWERQMLDDLSQQIEGLDAAGAAPDDIDAANRALRQISRRVR